MKGPSIQHDHAIKPEHYRDSTLSFNLSGAVVPNPVMDIRARTNRESQAYFKDQRLISGSRRVEALGLVGGALVIEHCPGKGELPRPVDGPVPCQVVPAGQAAHGQVAGGHLHLLQMDAARTRRHRHHRVVGCGERRGGTNLWAAATRTESERQHGSEGTQLL